MKFESFFLTLLFVACSSVCVLVMGAMLTASPASSQWATARRTAPAVAAQVDCLRPNTVDVCRARKG